MKSSQAFFPSAFVGERFIKVLVIKQTPVLLSSVVTKLLSVYIINPVHKYPVLVSKCSSQYSALTNTFFLEFWKQAFRFSCCLPNSLTFCRYSLVKTLKFSFWSAGIILWFLFLVLFFKKALHIYVWDWKYGQLCTTVFILIPFSWCFLMWQNTVF